MIVCTPVTATDEVDPRWGRADWIAVTTVRDGVLEGWERINVSWSTLHDEGSSARHHARVAKFLLDHGVEAVVANHVGDGMVRMLDTMKIKLIVDASGDARSEIVRLVG